MKLIYFFLQIPMRMCSSCKETCQCWKVSAAEGKDLSQSLNRATGTVPPLCSQGIKSTGRAWRGQWCPRILGRSPAVTMSCSIPLRTVADLCEERSLPGWRGLEGEELLCCPITNCESQPGWLRCQWLALNYAYS